MSGWECMRLNVLFFESSTEKALITCISIHILNDFSLMKNQEESRVLFFLINIQKSEPNRGLK